MIFVNGAPEFLMEWSNLNTAQKKEINEKISNLAISSFNCIYVY